MEKKHPGSVLKEEILARGISQKQFAAMIGMLPSHLSERINGKAPFTHAFAKKLEAALHIDAQEWMNLQLQYIYAQRRDPIPQEPDKDLVLSVSITDASLLSDIQRAISMLKGVGHIAVATR